MVAVMFDDIEKILVGWLPARLAAHGLPVPVSTRIPQPRPASFVRVLAIGGARRNLIADAPNISVEAWAGTETAASLLARTTRSLIESMAGLIVDGTTVRRSRDLSVPVNLPDPTTAQTRYTFTGTLFVSGVELQEAP